MLLLNFLLSSSQRANLVNFMLGIKIRTVLKSELNWLHKIITLCALEAKNFQKPRWPKYCETPCTVRYSNLGSRSQCQAKKLFISANLSIFSDIVN